MKKTLVKIFGVAVVIALLVGMLVAVVPAAAISYGSAAVTLSETTISGPSTYTIDFAVSFNLVLGDELIVRFPYDTTVPTTAAFAAAPGSVTLNGTDVSGALTSNVAARQVTITIPAAISVGNLNVLKFDSTTTAPLYNPSSPGGYSLSLATADGSGSPIEAAVSSPAYTIGLLTAVNVYNASGNLIGSPQDLQVAFNEVHTGYTVKLGAATYSNAAYILPATDASGNAITNVTITSADGNPADTIIGKAYPSTDITSFKISGSYITVSSLTFVGTVVNDATNATFTKCVFNQRGGSTNNTPLFTSCDVTPLGNPVVPWTAAVAAEGNLLTLSNSTFDTTANGGNTGGPTVAVQINDVVAPGTKTNDSVTGNTFKIGENVSLQQDIALQTGTTSFVLPAGVGATVTPYGPVVAATMNTFTGVNGGIGYQDGAGAVGVLIGNNFTGVQTALNVVASSMVAFQNNTVTKCITQTAPNYTGAIQIGVTAAAVAGANITITGNIITGNAGYSMEINALPTTPALTPPPGVGYAIIGNTFGSNAQGFYSIVNSADLSYALNYWGSPTGIGTTGSDSLAINSTGTLPTTFTPFLGAPATQGAVLPAAGATINTAVPALAPMVCGIVPSTFYEGTAGYYLSLTNLGTGNPTTVAPPATAINYYDIYTNDPTFTNNNQLMQLNFYAPGIDASTNAYFYNTGTGKWVYCDHQGAAGTGGYVYVTIGNAAANNGVLTNPGPGSFNGTYFVLVKGVAAPPATITIQSPSAANGLTTGLTNVLFSWDPVNTATGYQIIISANADFSSPVATQTVNATGYVYTGTLTAGAYYFQITAMQGTTVIAQGSGVFNAVASTTATTPQVTVTQPPETTITMTTVTTNVPPPTTTVLTVTQPAAVTPAWIWGIIGIGAILIIVVIVLIVRTRRTV